MITDGIKNGLPCHFQLKSVFFHFNQDKIKMFIKFFYKEVRSLSPDPGFEFDSNPQSGQILTR